MRQAALPSFYDRSEAPAQGLTPETLHASQTGAQAADAVRSTNMAVLLKLWSEPRSLQEVSALSGLPINSVCSLHAALRDQLQFAGYRIVSRPEGRETKQQRWVRK